MIFIQYFRNISLIGINQFVNILNILYRIYYSRKLKKFVNTHLKVSFFWELLSVVASSRIFRNVQFQKKNKSKHTSFLDDVRPVDVHHHKEEENFQDLSRRHPESSWSRDVEEIPGTLTTIGNAYPLHTNHCTLATLQTPRLFDEVARLISHI